MSAEPNRDTGVPTAARQWQKRRQHWQARLESGLAENFSQCRKDLRPELNAWLRYLERRLGKLLGELRAEFGGQTVTRAFAVNSQLQQRNRRIA